MEAHNHFKVKASMHYRVSDIAILHIDASKCLQASWNHQKAKVLLTEFWTLQEWKFGIGFYWYDYSLVENGQGNFLLSCTALFTNRKAFYCPYWLINWLKHVCLTIQIWYDRRLHMWRPNTVRLLSYIILFRNGMLTLMFLIMMEEALCTGMWKYWLHVLNHLLNYL